MWTLVLTALLVASAGSVPVPGPESRLPPPLGPVELHSYLLPPKIRLKWQPVTNGLEPVLGYKVRLWMAKGMKVYTHKTPLDGSSILVEVMKMPKLIDFKAEDGKLYEYQLTGPDHSELVVHDIKLGTPYLYEVLAYGPSGDGEPSGRSGFQLDSGGEEDGDV